MRAPRHLTTGKSQLYHEGMHHLLWLLVGSGMCLAITVMAGAGGIKGPESLLSIVYPGRAVADEEEGKSSDHPLT